MKPLTWEQRFADINVMRQRFAAVMSELIDDIPNLSIVMADITWERFTEAATKHPDRVINVGIREQLMIDIAGGMAMSGLRPFAHTFASFLVERPFEQIKIGLNHQGVGAVLVSAGASYDLAVDGRTHQSPGDVPLLATLPDWKICVPGHAEEAERFLRSSAVGTSLDYIRLSTETNARPYWHGEEGFVVLRRGNLGTVIVVGPLADKVVSASTDLDVTILYAPYIRPFDAETLKKTLSQPDIALVEPYLAGTSTVCVDDALKDIPHRVLSLGVKNVELRRFGTPEEHAAYHGLDFNGIKESLHGFFNG